MTGHKRWTELSHIIIVKAAHHYTLRKYLSTEYTYYCWMSTIVVSTGSITLKFYKLQSSDWCNTVDTTLQFCGYIADFRFPFMAIVLCLRFLVTLCYGRNTKVLLQWCINAHLLYAAVKIASTNSAVALWLLSLPLWLCILYLTL